MTGATGSVWKPEDDDPQGMEYDPADDEEAQECVVCKETKSSTSFRITRNGSRTRTCQRCISDKRMGRILPPPIAKESRDEGKT